MIGEKKRNIYDDLWWHCGPITYRTQSLLLVSCTHRNCNDNLYENEKYSWLPEGNGVLNWKPIHFYQIKAYKMHHSLATQWFNTMDRRNGNCPFHRCFPALNLTILTLNTTDGDIKHKTQSREPHRWLEGDHCAGVKIRIWKTGAMMQSLERSLGKLVNTTYKPSE